MRGSGDFVVICSVCPFVRSPLSPSLPRLIRQVQRRLPILQYPTSGGGGRRREREGEGEDGLL